MKKLLLNDFLFYAIDWRTDAFQEFEARY